MDPFLLILPPVTLSPLFFSTGILSPVNIDSSTEVYPCFTIPSTGIFSPGFTTITSPTATSSIGILTSFPSFITVASLGCSPINALIASEVLPLDTDSKYLPNIIKVIITPAVSKYSSIAIS